jgi:hypothetical protein
MKSFPSTTKSEAAARLNRRRGSNFNFPAKRRSEIVRHARYVGAGETEDLSRWLIEWVWNNPNSKDQIGAVMEAAKRMGRTVTEAEAAAITQEASICRKHLSADNVAKFLGVTYAQRQTLGLTTIGSVNVKKRARQELRKRNGRLYQERKRRAAGARPQVESLSQTEPWKAMKMSRRTWYRKNKSRNGTTSSTRIFLSTVDESVPTKRRGASAPRSGLPAAGLRPAKKQDAFRLPTAATMAADQFASLPLELRLAALCLPVPESHSVPQKKLRAA